MKQENKTNQNDSLVDLGLLNVQIHKKLEGVDLRALAERAGVTMATVRDFAFGWIGNKSAIDLEKIKSALPPES